MSFRSILNDGNLIAYLDGNGNHQRIQGVNGALTVSLVDSLTSETISTELDTYDLVPVLNADIDGVNYVEGSQGSIKTIKRYNSGALNGDYAILTTYKYSNSTFPKFYTNVTNTETTV